jgi:UDP-GlcNAc3NAcA epimerase
MVFLLKNCEMVMTDSGGLQKEAYFFQKQCLTLREETEWVELLDNGFNKICGSDKNNIIKAYQENKHKTTINFEKKLYGNGDAGRKIVSQIQKLHLD